MSYPEAFSLIPKYNSLYSHLPSSLILLAVFTPLSIRRGDGGEAVDGLLVRLVVFVIEASSFLLGGVGGGLCPRLIPDNLSLIHPHLSLCTMTEYRVLSASSPLQPYQRIHGDYHH